MKNVLSFCTFLLLSFSIGPSVANEDDYESLLDSAIESVRLGDYETFRQIVAENIDTITSSAGADGGVECNILCEMGFIGDVIPSYDLQAIEILLEAGVDPNSSIETMQAILVFLNFRIQEYHFDQPLTCSPERQSALRVIDLAIESGLDVSAPVSSSYIEVSAGRSLSFLYVLSFCEARFFCNTGQDSLPSQIQYTVRESLNEDERSVLQSATSSGLLDVGRADLFLN